MYKVCVREEIVRAAPNIPSSEGKSYCCRQVVGHTEVGAEEDIGVAPGVLIVLLSFMHLQSPLLESSFSYQSQKSKCGILNYCFKICSEFQLQ